MNKSVRADLSKYKCKTRYPAASSGVSRDSASKVIQSQNLRHRRRGIYVKGIATVMALLTFLVASEVRAQDRNIENFRFDVATVRPFAFDGNEFSMSISNPIHTARFEASGISVKKLLSMAYGVEENQIEGMPVWLNSELYTVKAKSDDAVDAKLLTLSDQDAKLAKKYMLQALLVERFRLKARNVTTKGSVYVLVIAKGGHKLRSFEGNAAAVGTPDTRVLYREGDVMIFHHIAFPDFVGFLSSALQRKVVDETGLTGSYDFRLLFRREVEGVTIPGSSLSAPSLEDALPAQLGLKLESQKGEMNSLVIDHIEEPSPN